MPCRRQEIHSDGWNSKTTTSSGSHWNKWFPVDSVLRINIQFITVCWHASITSDDLILVPMNDQRKPSTISYFFFCVCECVCSLSVLLTILLSCSSSVRLVNYHYSFRSSHRPHEWRSLRQLFEVLWRCLHCFEFEMWAIVTDKPLAIPHWWDSFRFDWGRRRIGGGGGGGGGVRRGDCCEILTLLSLTWILKWVETVHFSWQRVRVICGVRNG